MKDLALSKVYQLLKPAPSCCSPPPVVDTRLTNKYSLFILEVVKAWVDPRQENPCTNDHQGYGRFAVDGKTINIRPKMP